MAERACEYGVIRRRGAQGRVAAPGQSATSDAAQQPLQIGQCNILSDALASPNNSLSSPACTLALEQSATPGRSPGHQLQVATNTDPEASVNTHHLRLILHFSLSTAVPELPDHLAKGGTELVLRLALETPYLLYQVLAISSRHLAHLHPDKFQFHNEQAVKFQTNAIEGFNASTPLGSDACMPAVLFSSILSRHSMVDTLNARKGGFATFLNSFVQCAQVQKGIRAVVAGVSWSSLLDSDLAPFLKWGGGMGDRDTAARGHECDQLLRLLAITSGLDPVSRESCRAAVHYLQIGLDDLAKPVPGSNSYRMIYGWNIYLSDEFIDLLAKYRPEAVAIVGWYAVLLHRGRHMWQIGDAGAFVLKSAVEFLGMEWSHWLEWPQSIILI